MNNTGVALLKGFVQTVLEQFGDQVMRDEWVLKGFSAVNSVDSTQISLPEAYRGLIEGSGGSVRYSAGRDTLAGLVSADQADRQDEKHAIIRTAIRCQWVDPIAIVVVRIIE